MKKYYCYSCMQVVEKYCGTTIEIGPEPTETWPEHPTPCALQAEYVEEVSE